MSRSLIRMLPRALRSNFLQDRLSPRSVTPFFGPSWGGLDVVDREFRRMENMMDRMQQEMSQMWSDSPFLSRGSSDVTEGMFRIIEEGGKKKVRVQFDAQDVKPENIEVKSFGNRLEIHGKTEEKSDYHTLHQEFSRAMTLPEGVKSEELSCKFEDGVVTLEAPYNPPAIEGKESRDIEVKREEREPVRKEIPIKREKQQ